MAYKSFSFLSLTFPLQYLYQISFNIYILVCETSNNEIYKNKFYFFQIDGRKHIPGVISIVVFRT